MIPGVYNVEVTSQNRVLGQKSQLFAPYLSEISESNPTYFDFFAPSIG